MSGDFTGKEENRVKQKKFLCMMLLAAAVFLGNMRLAYASEEDSQGDDSAKDNLADAAMLQISVDEDEVIAYIACSGKPDAVDAQIAQYPCETVQVNGAEDISVHTFIMVDNSLSVTQENRENIKNILKQYVQRLPEQEAVSLATFGEEMQLLCKRSQDAEELLSLADEITFHDQDTYLTDYLYEALEEVRNDPVYTRFIVISDGVDNKTIGITKEELSEKLKEIARPVYTIGHIYKNNTEELKNMFALSRITGAKEFLMEDFEDISLIAEEIHDFSNVYSCRMKIPENVMDGANRHVLLKIHTAEETMEVTGEAPMPFGLIEETESVEEPEPEPVQKPEPAPVEEPTAQPEQPAVQAASEEAEETPEGEKLYVVALVFVIVVAVLLLLYIKRKPKDKSAKKRKTPPKAVKGKPEPEMPVLPKKQETAPVQSVEEEETVLLDGRYLLVLRDQTSPEKVFRYPLDRHVVVGRNVDRVQIAIDYSLTVSGQHCEFYVKGNQFFVRDIHSSNHTYVNGKQINGETEIESGYAVRLGEVEFRVEIMPL